MRPLAWALAAFTLAELAWTFVLLLVNFINVQTKLAALPSGPGFTDMVSVPLLSSLLTGGSQTLGLTELAIFVVPLFAMSTLASERSNGTLNLLFGSGLSSTSIVLGKYLALMLWLLLWLALTLAMPLTLAHATHFDWGKLAAAVLGIFLLLAMLGSIGIACSAFTPYPGLAAFGGIMLSLALCSVQLGAQSVGINNGFLNWIALPTHLEPLLRGLVSTTDVVWFVLFTVLALALAVRRLNSDKERG